MQIRKMRRAYVTLLIMAALLGGCGPTRNAAGGNVTLDVQQSGVGPAQVDVTLHDPNGQPVSGADVQLRGDMTHAGMQPVLTKMDDLGNGQYRAANFEFTMAGDWVLTVQANMPDGGAVERTFDVRGVVDQ